MITALERDMAIARQVLESFQGEDLTGGWRILSKQLSAHLGHQSVSHSSGAYRMTLVFDNIVVKRGRKASERDDWASNETRSDVVQEWERISALRSTDFAEYFPVTELVKTAFGPVLIQEKVTLSTYKFPKMHESTVMRDLASDLFSAVSMFASGLGVGDMHSENFGWTRENHIVLFDVEHEYWMGTGETNDQYSRWLLMEDVATTFLKSVA